MSQIYIALFRNGTDYHWSLFAPQSDNLSLPMQAFHITGNVAGWYRGIVSDTYFLRSATFLFCIAIPLRDPNTMSRVRDFLWAQEVNQGSTPLLRERRTWTCAQWVIRAIGELAVAGYIQDQFYTSLPKWRDLFFTNVYNAAHAVMTRRVGTARNGVRIVQFNSDGVY